MWKGVSTPNYRMIRIPHTVKSAHAALQPISMFNMFSAFGRNAETCGFSINITLRWDQRRMLRITERYRTGKCRRSGFVKLGRVGRREVFPFPSNGKVYPKNIVRGDDIREACGFQFPSNGKAYTKFNILVLTRRR